jgi:phosphoribosyl 1,2-cyclic phosphodiesterase
MIVTVLGTGSQGNAIVVECDDDRILIDAGFPARTLVRRLRLAGIAPESIRALVLTHAHGDHAYGARVAARHFRWAVYATQGTIDAMPELASLSPVAISPRGTLQLDTLRIAPLRIPHDCAEPIALRVESTATGARLGVAYDLGHVPLAVERALHDLDALIVESNHDEIMLRNGPYPRSVQQRISGAYGHLSNGAAARIVRRIANRDLRHVVLVHLSEQNNTADLARETVARGLRGTDFRGALTVAGQHALTRLTVARTRRVEQMSLF